MGVCAVEPAKGLTHIYYGDGKGKTTAALGLALRASGCGKSVVIVQFLKNWNCGELDSLALLPGVVVLRGKAGGSSFLPGMSDEEKVATKAIHDENLKKAIVLQGEGRCDLMILDEAVEAYSLGLLDAVLFETLLHNKPEPLELVITGHSADARLLRYADYVTEMVKRRHPYDSGVKARRGIEF